MVALALKPSGGLLASDWGWIKKENPQNYHILAQSKF